MARPRTGTITEIKGKLYARVTFTDSFGKRQRIYRPAENRTHARQLIRQMLNELETGGENIFDGDRMTFKQVAEVYSKTHLVEAEYRDDRKIAGVRSLKSSLANLNTLIEYFGTRRIRSINYSDLEQYKIARLNVPTHRGAPRKIASVNRELELLRAVMHHAHREGWILVNPFQKGKALISKADEVQRDRVLLRDEESRLLAACAGRRAHIRPIVICAIDTAMRRGEMWRLTWNNVDLQGGVIRIPGLITKTLQYRTAPITPRLKEELEKLWWRALDKEKGLVFGIEDSIKKAWASACKEAGIEGLRFHDLRHTAITRMIQAGIPANIVAKISGHTQMTTFMRYLNPDESIIKQAGQAIADLNMREATQNSLVN